MTKHLWTFALVALLCGLLVPMGTAGDKDKKKEKPNPVTKPEPRMSQQPDPGWLKRHEGFVAIAKKGDVDVLFPGDSITDAWRGGAAKPTWEKYFVPVKAANFGIGGGPHAARAVADQARGARRLQAEGCRADDRHQ